MLNYFRVSAQQYVDQLVLLITLFEGHRPTAERPPGDPNVTIGYGYTFSVSVVLTALGYEARLEGAPIIRFVTQARTDFSFSDGTVWLARDAFSNAPYIFSDLDESRTGTEGPDIIDALGGNDQIRGAGGDDIVYGGGGWQRSA